MLGPGMQPSNAEQQHGTHAAHRAIARPQVPTRDVPARRETAAGMGVRTGLPMLSSSGVLSLQRTVGNAAVTQLLRRAAGQHPTAVVPRRPLLSAAPRPLETVQRSSGLIIQRMDFEQFKV